MYSGSQSRQRDFHRIFEFIRSELNEFDVDVEVRFLRDKILIRGRTSHREALERLRQFVLEEEGLKLLSFNVSLEQTGENKTAEHTPSIQQQG